jgi:hypothetical protein
MRHRGESTPRYAAQRGVDSALCGIIVMIFSEKFLILKTYLASGIQYLVRVLKGFQFKAFCRVVFLKGQCHEIFDPRFFSLNCTSGSPDSWA